MFEYLKTILILLLISTRISVVFGQNLVPNGSFEVVNTCNVNNAQQSALAINDWFTLESPDFFNTCFVEPIFSPPNVYSGYSNPLNYNGMVGLALLPELGYREAISIQLKSNLIKDSAYCFSFWLKNSKQGGYDYSTDMVDCLFSNDSITMPTIVNSNYSGDSDPTVEAIDSESIDGWERVHGYYISTSNEKYFTISFLGDMSYTTNAPAEENAIYYFIDSVEVFLCNKDSLLSVHVELPNVFTPNFDDVNDSFVIKSKNIKTMKVQVFNRWGNLVNEFSGLNSTWAGTDQLGTPLNEGVYFVRVIAESTFGDFIEKSSFVHLVR